MLLVTQLGASSVPRRRVSDSDLADVGDDSFPPEPLDLLSETDLFGGLALAPPQQQLRQSYPGECRLCHPYPAHVVDPHRPAMMRTHLLCSSRASKQQSTSRSLQHMSRHDSRLVCTPQARTV